MRTRNRRDDDGADITWPVFFAVLILIGTGLLIYKATVFLPVANMVGSTCSVDSWVRGVDGMLFVGDVLLLGAGVGSGLLVGRSLSEDHSDLGLDREISEEDGWNKPLMGVTVVGVSGALLTFGGWMALRMVETTCASGLWSGVVVHFLAGVV